jgi:uncharacterized protein YdbL (DUF1318 family)
MKRIVTAFALSCLLVAGVGCVVRTEHTINAHITLDIRHIEQQADNLLDFIEGNTDTLPAPASQPTSRLRDFVDFLRPVQTAHAAELKSTTSATTQELAKSMRARNAEVDSYRSKGCFGENNRGYLELRDCDALKDAAARNAAQKLMADENKDRKALYAEIAKLNADQGVSVSTVESIFHTQRFKRGKAGEVFQLPASGEFFEGVKNTAQAKNLGPDFTPGAWVTLK